MSGRNFTDEKDAAILDFLAEKAKFAQIPLKMAEIWKECSILNSRPVSTLYYRFQRHLSQKLSTSRKFDTETKLRILFATNYPVPERLLDEVKNNCEVLEVKKGRIMRYKRGGVELTAYGEDGKVHVETEKMKKAWATRRKRKISSKIIKMEPLEYQDQLDCPEEPEEQNLIEKEPREQKDEPISLKSIKMEPLEYQDHLDFPEDPEEPISPEKEPQELVEHQKYQERSDISEEPISSKIIKLEPLEFQDHFPNHEEPEEPIYSKIVKMEPIDDPEEPEHLKNGKTLLENLQILVISLNSPELVDLQEKMRNALKLNFKFKEKKIPIAKVLTALNTIFLAVKTPPLFPETGDSTSRKELLKFLMSIVISLEEAELQNLQDRIRIAIRLIGERDEKISISKIRVALEIAFNLLFS